MKMNALDWIAFVLVIIGALNWGLIGFFKWDLVAAIFGTTFGDVTTITRIIYALVGLAALYMLATAGKMKGNN